MKTSTSTDKRPPGRPPNAESIKSKQSNTLLSHFSKGSDQQDNPIDMICDTTEPTLLPVPTHSGEEQMAIDDNDVFPPLPSTPETIVNDTSQPTQGNDSSGTPPQEQLSKEKTTAI